RARGGRRRCRAAAGTWFQATSAIPANHPVHASRESQKPSEPGSIAEPYVATLYESCDPDADSDPERHHPTPQPDRSVAGQHLTNAGPDPLGVVLRIALSKEEPGLALRARPGPLRSANS